MTVSPSAVVLVAAVGAAGVIVWGSRMNVHAQTTLGSTDRVEALIAAMTLEEKVGMLHGAPDPIGTSGAGYISGVPRLGIPPLRLADGPAGVRTSQPATALPAPVALAATFDEDLARRYGEVMGRELRARGQDVLLAPMVNIVRVPHAGRNFETFGEDPLLASRIVAAQVTGIQSQGAIATVKHFAANNQEDQRTSIDVRVDDRTLHEIELPPFEAAVRAGAGAVMAAYNRVNGTYASQNAVLLTDVLRRQWGFSGFVMSDWGGTHSAAPALTAGLDLEMPAGTHFRGLSAAVSAGDVPAAAVDAAVRHILRQIDRAGLLAARAPLRPVIDEPAHRRVARDVAIAGAVLLRNERQLLPLGADDLAAVAVVGPTGRVPLIGGGGSARVEPLRTESPLAAIRRRAGASARIEYEPGIDLDGVPVPAAALGLRETIDATGPRRLPAATSRTWNATLRVPVDGEYELRLQADRGQAALRIDDEILIGRGGGAGGPQPPPGFGPALNGSFGGVFRPSVLDTADGLQNAAVTRRLQAGRGYRLVVTATAPQTAAQQIRLSWMTPPLRAARLAAAVAAARRARVAVVFVHNEGTEGRDRRSLGLPGEQDALVAAVAAANPRTVVVMNTGDPVTLPWVDHVPAILQMWYAGQEGGDATAALLAGDASPGGKLPVTFPRRAEDTPTNRPARYPGIAGRQEYSEGVFVGYRWYDQERIEPLFPFGHGLSYGRFSYSALAVRPSGDGYEVAFSVRNDGTHAAAEVAQVYVGPADGSAVPMPPNALAGFARLTLDPGASRSVSVGIDARALLHWSSAEGRWVRAGGRAVHVGSSSRDIRLRGRLP